jgi:hypothetical protein
MKVLSKLILALRSVHGKKLFMIKVLYLICLKINLIKVEG